MSTAVHATPLSAVPRTPRLASVVREQLLAVGLAVRGEMTVAAALMATVGVLMVAASATAGGKADFDFADMSWPVVALGLFAAMGVWKGESPSRRGYHWSMPVDRFRHALAKVFAGWAWLMALVGAYLLWALGTALVTGGHVVVGPAWEEALLRDLPAGSRILDLSLHGEPWMWLVPFAGATVTYLAGSIVALATDHPWRWYAGIAFGYFLLVALSELGDVGLGDLVLAHHRAVFGRYGLLTLITGTHDPTFGNGGALPLTDAGTWAVAALIWMLPPLAGVLVAAHRYQER